MWSIELCETLARWTYLHRPVFGRPVYHTFLRLMNNRKDVVQEIHGGAAVFLDGRSQRITTQNFIRAAVRNLTWEGKPPAMTLLARGYEGAYRDTLYIHDLKANTKDRILEEWSKVLSLAAAINDAAAPYKTRTMNCNSVTRRFCLGIDVDDIRLKSYTPGFESPVPAQFASLSAYFKAKAEDTDSHTPELVVDTLFKKVNAPFVSASPP